MALEIVQDKLRLFRFTVPGLPDIALALAMQEVVAVAKFSTVTPAPAFRPLAVGLGEWQGNVATIVDMAAALSKQGRAEFTPDPASRYLVAQVVLDAQREVVAWPILPGSSTLLAPPRAPQADVPPNLAAELIYAAIILDDQPLILLNLQGLRAYGLGGEETTASG